jgi:hypothetical protein
MLKMSSPFLRKNEGALTRKIKMKNKKIKPIILGIALLALAACSSSFGGGDPPPNKVNVVVPPNSTTYQSPN